MTTILITEMVTAMSTVQASNLSPIEVAARTQNILFVVYVFVLVLVAVLTALSRQAALQYQALVKADADARIAEATRDAARANEGQQQLENANLGLRGDLNEAIGQVAGLQREAADARAAQQRVEIELARQRERAAIAERDLLEMQERVEPRSISAAQRERLIEALTNTPKGPIWVQYVQGVSSVEGPREAVTFAKEIRDVLTACGWPPGPVHALIDVGSTLTGVEMRVQDAEALPPHAADLQRAFASVGIPLDRVEHPGEPEGRVRILVGGKP